MRTFTLLAALSFVCPAARASEKTAPETARLSHIVGIVEVESGGKIALVKAGRLLTSGDWVGTAAKSAAVIELPDGSGLKVKELSRFQLMLPGEKGRTTSGLLSFGGVFAKVAKVLEGSAFEIKTESAVAAVRGTEFFVAFGRGKKSKRDLWVCVNKGAVDVTTTAEKTPLRVPAGKGILIKSGLELTKPQAYDWTKQLNWNMDPKSGNLEDKTNLDSAYADLLDQDYR